MTLPSYTEAGIREYLRTLEERPPVDLHVLLDERGTPADDQRFITAGIAAYGDLRQLGNAWDAFLQRDHLGKAKGRRLVPSQLTAVAQFLSTQAVLPVGYHSHLSAEKLEQLKRFADHYARSRSPAKLFPKVSARSFLWKQQVPLAAASAFTSVLLQVGPVRTATLRTDRVSDPPLVQEAYRTMLQQRLRRSELGRGVAVHGAPAALATFLERSSPPSWDINLNSNGRLAKIADFACTMYEQWLSAVHREPWELLRRSPSRPGLSPPRCAGVDGTPELRAWLARLYTEGDPNRYA